jgi:hypothetical protein
LVGIFIYSILFKAIQPIWDCRQIPKHKITDMSKRRNQANKQTQNETKFATQKKPSYLTCGLYPSDDKALIVNTNKSKKKRTKNFNLLRPGHVSNIVLREMAPSPPVISLYPVILLVTHLLNNQTQID